ncbi:Kynurenine formamidase [Madurella fahalii]|uniref:Kynurenine formamidase n=1 Tax=Madurella fahalii TaxID=1157608 RepID=A0ABQ0G598_9PEZI
MPLKEATISAWASVPWAPVTDEATGDIIGWHKADLPYLAPGEGVPLQTFEIWIPAHETDPSEPPDASVLPRNPTGRWIIYVHGGAWRDAAIGSASFGPAAVELLRRVHRERERQRESHLRPAVGAGVSPPAVEGIASLNYRLSPHPAHPSPCPSRSARHPDHIRDVLAALATISERLDYDTLERSVLVGHSCGATLAFQAVMSAARWRGTTGGGDGGGGGSSSGSSGSVGVPEPPKPSIVVGFNGLYDLAGFIASPPAGYEGLREAYEEFTRGAFGTDERVWRAVCPATAEGWVDEWVSAGEGSSREVVLVQSRGDTLVPYEQLEAMRGYLEQDGRVRVREMEAEGDHDDIWRNGERMAEILWEVVKGLE